MAQLETDFANYLQQLEVVKGLRRELKDMKDEHPKFDELAKKTKEIQKLRSQLLEDADIAIVKEKLDTELERMQLLKEILEGRMIEEGQTEVNYQGQVAKLVSSMKVGKTGPN